MKALLSMLVLFSLVSCATKKNDEKDVDQKIQSSNVKDSQGLGETIKTMIHSSTTLSAAQKMQLENIFAANKQRAEELTEKSYRLRSVLIKELLSGKVNQKEVKILKKDIRKVEADRLHNTFTTVDKVSDIVTGHPNHSKFIEHVIMEERHSR